MLQMETIHPSAAASVHAKRLCLHNPTIPSTVWVRTRIVCGQLRVNFAGIGCLLFPTMAFANTTRLVVSRDRDQAPDRKRTGQ